jgi:prepilin-type N-terminal cleavage/methylation domain-containing protein
MNKSFNALKNGFTLIELLIVVAIIAILAAIAVPNFLEAQVRAKVARAKADQRTITTGLETYHIDTNKYPWCSSNNLAVAYGTGVGSKTPTLERLTTPIAYLTGVASFMDPFKAPVQDGQWVGVTQTQLANLPTDSTGHALPNYYWYTSRNMQDSAVWGQTTAHDIDPKWWFLQSAGPDAKYNFVYYMLNSMRDDTPLNRTNCARLVYDPTNGTTSYGGIWRVGGLPSGCWGSSFYYAAAKQLN